MAQECSPIVAQLILSQLSVGPTIGVSYIGVALSTLVYGITCCQTFYYFRSEKGQQDHWYLKALVSMLMFVSTVQEAFIIHSIYYYTIINFANPCIVLGNIIWSIPAEMIVNSIIELGVEGFLTYRIWRLGRNIYVTTICALLALTESILTTFYPAQMLRFPGGALQALNTFRHLGIGSLAYAVVADATISATLTFYLWRSRTGFRRNDGIITRLMVLTVSTGASVSAIVAADLIAYLVAPNELYVLFFNYPIGKMYINVLLTTLNMRGALAASNQSTMKGVNSIPLTNIGLSDVNQFRHGDPPVDRPINVSVYKPRPGLSEPVVLRTSIVATTEREGEEV